MNRVKNTFSGLIVNRFGIHFTNLTSSFYLPLKISLLPKKKKKHLKVLDIILFFLFMVLTLFWDWKFFIFFKETFLLNLGDSILL